MGKSLLHPTAARTSLGTHDRAWNKEAWGGGALRAQWVDLASEGNGCWNRARHSMWGPCDLHCEGWGDRWGAVRRRCDQTARGTYLGFDPSASLLTQSHCL